MYRNIIEYLKNKKIAILGFGLEGKSTYQFLRNYLKKQELTIIDQNEVKNDPLLQADNNLLFVWGAGYLDHLDDYEIVIKTPGISLIDKTYTCEIVSQFSLLLSLTNVFVVGITGTKGKSTTTSLIYQIIKDQHENVYLGGNIGIPVFDFIESLDEKSIVVAEMSAYQLYDIKRSPNIGLILNLYEEHLDYFHNLNNYYESKLNMFKYQSKKDFALYYKDNLALYSKITKLKLDSSLMGITQADIKDDWVYLFKEKVYNLKETKYLIGEYNKINILFALNVANLLNLNLTKASQTIMNFKTLPHRIELVGTYQKIDFYDDTLATIPHATLNSIKAIANIETLIFGGLDRKIDYRNFASELIKTKVKNYICLPETGHKVAEDLANLAPNLNIIKVDNMENAVKEAYKLTSPLAACLLSPAASSYNQYKNYEEKSLDYKNKIVEFCQ